DRKASTGPGPLRGPANCRQADLRPANGNRSGSGPWETVAPGNSPRCNRPPTWHGRHPAQYSPAARDGTQPDQHRSPVWPEWQPAATANRWSQPAVPQPDEGTPAGHSPDRHQVWASGVRQPQQGQVAQHAPAGPQWPDHPGHQTATAKPGLG